MQEDLLKQPHGPIPLIIVCFVLVLIEVFLQQELNALFHLRGAIKLLQERRKSRHASLLTSSVAPDIAFGSSEDDVEIIVRMIDLQTCSYALSKSPEISALPVPPT